MKVYERKAEVDGAELTLLLAPFENGVIVILCEGGLRLGTIAYALPSPLSTPMTSAVLIGGKFHFSARILAEKAVRIFNRMSLVSVNIQIEESKALKKAVELMKEVKLDHVNREVT